MGNRAYAAATLLIGAFCLTGCFYSHGVFETVHDNQLTYDDYDGATSYEAAPGTSEASPPIEVHEFDQDAVKADGGTKVIDGHDWLTADDYERNELLNKAENGQSDSILVIVVATGDIWRIPNRSLLLWVNGTLREWQGDEYDQLDEYVGERYKDRTLTRMDYLKLSTIANDGMLAPVYYIHDLGPIGRQEIKSAKGFQVIPHQWWLASTPTQRFAKLDSLAHFLKMLPDFQGPQNTPAFGISIPWGSVYAVPKQNYQNLIYGGAVKPFTLEQAYSLPVVAPPAPHWQRNNEPTFTLGTSFKF